MAIAEEVEALLSELTPREEHILHLRFGIGNGAREIDEVAECLSLTAAAVRRIERSALRKLRLAAVMDACAYAG